MLARQLAWASVPTKGADGKQTKVSRIEQIEADGGELPMPELSMPHLWVYLQDAGLCERGDMGPKPLSSAELQAWASGTGHHLAPWEFKALRAASRAFVAQTASEDTYPPYGDPDSLYDPDVIEARMAQLLDRLATPKRKS